MCHRLRSVNASRRADRSMASCPRVSSNTLNSTDFTHRRRRDVAPSTRWNYRRQAGCMAKSDKRKKVTRLPSQIDRAIAAAEDKNAVDLVLLDLRKAAGFTAFFSLASAGNARHVRPI